MLYYPKIPGSRNCPDGQCIAFEKYDGTNLHWDWDRDFGWHAFGTRRDVFNLTAVGIADFQNKHQHLRECIEVFQNIWAVELERVFNDNPQYQAVQEIKVFGEFLGANSFAGLHRSTDPKEFRLFDVLLEGFGLISPSQFVNDFQHLEIARVVYRGKLTGKFTEDVRSGKYNVDEGVICKGGTGGADLWMVKIKTNAYMSKLKQAFADRWEDYWE
jgi:RNA ligase